MDTERITCEWRYNIANCKTSLIYRRLELRPNVKFWSTKAWRSMNLFFLWFILYYLLRSFASLVVVLGLFSDNITIVITIYDLSWSPGIIAILLYIKDMFHLISRLKFDQFTSHNFSLNKKKSTKKVWIPKGEGVKFIFWSISIFVILSMLIFSLLKGHFYYLEEKKTFLEIPLLISSLFISALFLYYGKILITLTKNCLIITEEDNFENDRNHLSFIFQQNKLKLKTYLRKMMIFNLFCGINFLLIAISIVFFFFPTIRTIFTLNLTLCIFTCVICPTFTIALHTVMILLEATKRHNNNSTVTVHVETTQLYSTPKQADPNE